MAIKFLIRKGGKFLGQVLDSGEEWIIKGELPCLIGALVLANHDACRDGFEIIWDDSHPVTQRYIRSKHHGFSSFSSMNF